MAGTEELSERLIGHSLEMFLEDEEYGDRDNSPQGKKNRRLIMYRAILGGVISSSFTLI